MKITVIGDLHGRQIWRQIVAQNMDSDKIVFLGDYHDIYSSEFDDTAVAIEESIQALKDLIRLKEMYPDKFVLIMGNHDSHYMYDCLLQCTRFDYANKLVLQKIFKDNKDLFQYAYQYKNYLFTHAGVSNAWFNTYVEDKYELGTSLKECGLKDDLSNLAEALNKFGDFNEKSINAINDIPWSRGGRGPNGGPTWAHKTEFYDYRGCHALEGFHQYVGHNRMIEIKTVGEKETTLTFCDVIFNNEELEKLYINLKID